MLFSSETKNNLRLWLEGSFCTESEKNQIQNLIKTNPEEIENSFYSSLSFGTGGLRGLMGLGPNRMNIYTIRETTQGISNYILSYYKSLPEKKLSVVIGYDSRHHSKEFALETARVFAGNGFQAHLFKEISPTPLVSFACRYLKASCAVMITASHNPPAYNGYKVYWSYGGQVLPPHDEAMMREVEKVRTTRSPIQLSSEQDSAISLLDEEIDQAYLAAILEGVLWKDKNTTELKPVYSPLHGTGSRLMKQALSDAGIQNMMSVSAQMIPDGSFSTVVQPNPEDPKALKMGIEQLLREAGDIFIASDPDADRLGVVVQHKGAPVILTGNQIASIMCEWIFRALHEQKRLPKEYGIVKSCVTTPLLDAIAQKWGSHIEQVLPGFKYIAQTIEKWLTLKNPKTFIFGAEESYGTLYGLHVRDKDAISSGVVICEIAWYMKCIGKTLVDALEEIYSIYGYYLEDLLNLVYEETKEGREKREAVLQELRKTPPTQIDEIDIVAIQDLEDNSFHGDQRFCLRSTFPKTDLLVFTLADSTQIIVRPSGTEPKIKIYFFLRAEKYDRESCTKLQNQAQRFKEWFLKSYTSPKR